MDASIPKTRARRRWAVALLAVALVVSMSACELAAPTGDGPLRFRDEVFSSVDITRDIAYGSAVTQAGAPITLALDLYEPAGDDMARRPLVIWMHGGSFSGGNRTSPEIVDEANFFARRGYVNASISYRLSARGCTVIDAACIESIIDATEDAQAAVRFFRAHADEYGIDTDRIAIAGTSAGAITALHVGFGLSVPGNSGTPGERSDVAAAVSLSGAAVFQNAIDSQDAKTLLFHGSADTVVPYAWASDTHAAAQAASLRTHLVTWEGAGHVPYVENREQILELTQNFLFHSLGVRLLLPA